LLFQRPDAGGNVSDSISNSSQSAFHALAFRARRGGLAD
jgi:hypothetical protein